VSKIQWGIIGCGDIVLRRVGPALQALADAEPAAVSRRTPTALAECARTVGAARSYSNWRDLIKEEAIEAVYIATPVALHAEQTVAAAENGKHVLCEKPLAMDAGQCARMIDTCRANKVQLGAAFYRRYYPVVKRINAIIGSGEIGDVILAQINAAETTLFESGHPRHWILEKHMAGGGCLMDFGCHRIEILLHLLGNPAKAAGATGQVYRGHDVEDSAVVTLAFETGAAGVVTVVRGGTVDRDDAFIQGTRGTVRVDSLNTGRLQITTGDGTRREEWPCHENPHLPLIEAFCRALREGRAPEVDGAVGLAVQRIIDAVYG
jgi:predicted dehydrogenase